MKTKLIPMGSSRGLRIPETVIEQCGLTGQIEMLIQGRNLVIRAHRRPRSGWEEAFAKMASQGLVWKSRLHELRRLKGRIDLDLDLNAVCKRTGKS